MSQKYFGHEIYTKSERDKLLYLYIKIASANDLAKSMINEDLQNAVCEWGSLLRHAVSCDNEEIVRYLIERKGEFNIDYTDDYGRTVLMQAIILNKLPIVKVLLEANASVFVSDHQCRNALQMAFDAKYETDIREVMISNVRRKFDKNDELVDLLLETGCTMFQATYMRDIEVLKCMLSRGCDINTSDHYGNTALHAAVKINEKAMVKWLVDSGADMEVRNNNGKTPLDLASVHGYVGVLKVLLEVGADPNASDKFICTPLSEIVVKVRAENEEQELQFYECVKLLLQYGAIPSNVSSFAYFLIFSTVRFGRHQESIRKLILNSMIAQLTLLEAIADPKVIKSDKYMEYNNRLRSYSKFHERYAECQKILNIAVVGSLSIRNLLIDSDIRMRIYARKKIFFARLTSKLQTIYSEYKISEFYPYYYQILVSRIENAIGMVKIEEKAILAVCKIFKRSYNECYVVARRVVDYLGDDDVELLNQV